jgi:hypothetical protein
MKKNWLIGIVSAALALAVSLSFSSSGWADATKYLLKGDVWTRMTQDEKVAYLWGGGDVVDIERQLMEDFPQLKVENFSFKVRQGFPTSLTNNDVARVVDKWYKDNPDKLNVTVIRVIWDTMIKPHLKTGIAGRSLKDQ